MSNKCSTITLHDLAYCRLYEFYENVADFMQLPYGAKSYFNSDKIKIGKTVKSIIKSYYTNELNFTDEEFDRYWFLVNGPDDSFEEGNLYLLVEDGFVVNEHGKVV